MLRTELQAGLGQSHPPKASVLRHWLHPGFYVSLQALRMLHLCASLPSASPPCGPHCHSLQDGRLFQACKQLLRAEDADAQGDQDTWILPLSDVQLSQRAKKADPGAQWNH